MKIVIEVSGGVVQEVYSDSPNIEYTLVDWDDIKDVGAGNYHCSSQTCLPFSALPEETATVTRLPL